MEAASIDPKRELEKSALNALNALHTGQNRVMKLPHFFESSKKEETNVISKVNEIQESNESKGEDEAVIKKQMNINDLSIEIQQNILSFLGFKDHLMTRVVNKHYYQLTSNVSYLNLQKGNPNLDLKEPWMNLALNNFLQKYFNDGKLNGDDLLMLTDILLFNFPVENSENQLYKRNPITLTFLSFLYEYEYGVGSSLPLNRNEIYSEIYKRLFKRQDVSRSISILNDYHEIFKSRNSMDIDMDVEIENYIQRAIALMQTDNPDRDTILSSLDYIPDERFRSGSLKYLPEVLKAHILHLILPFAIINRRTSDYALRLFIKANIYSEEFFNYFNQNYPSKLNNLNNDGNNALYPRSHKALAKMFSSNDYNGLEYILTRDAANPFDIDILKAETDNIYSLLFVFNRNNTLSLTEIDMLTQMKEAGMLEEIKGTSLYSNIESHISHHTRFDKGYYKRIIDEDEDDF